MTRPGLHFHTWHGPISRRAFLGASAGAAGVVATSSLWWPAMARAAEAASRVSPDVLPMTPRPVVIPGGDVVPAPDNLIHQFVPGPVGVNPLYEGIDSEPNGITNFRGLVALGYTTGTAKDSHGHFYNATTDNRVYQGEYIAVDGRHARGTFVEI